MNVFLKVWVGCFVVGESSASPWTDAQIVGPEHTRGTLDATVMPAQFASLGCLGRSRSLDNLRRQHPSSIVFFCFFLFFLFFFVFFNAQPKVVGRRGLGSCMCLRHARFLGLRGVDATTHPPICEGDASLLLPQKATSSCAMCGRFP